MIKEYLFTGKSIEAALNNAAAELKIAEDDISYEIVDIPVKGFFGIGGTHAKIKVFVESKESAVVEKKPVTAPKSEAVASKPVVSTPKTVATSKPVVEKQAKAISEKPINTNIDIDDLKLQINTLLKLMKADNSQCEVNIVGETVNIEITGSDAGLLIGKHGDTLDAISYFINLYLNRKTDSRTCISLDIEGYRQKKIEALEGLADKMANTVIKNKRNVTLEPMTAFQRRVIHSKLQEFEGITTYSVGNDPYRKIVIAVKKD